MKKRDFAVSIIITIMWAVILIVAASVGVIKLSAGSLIDSRQQGETNVVCGKDIADEFSRITGSTDGYNQDSLKTIAGEIKNKSGYEKDIVCSYIVLHTDSLGGDKDVIKESKDRFEKALSESANRELLYKLGVSKFTINKLTDEEMSGRG